MINFIAVFLIFLRVRGESSGVNA